MPCSRVFADTMQRAEGIKHVQTSWRSVGRGALGGYAVGGLRNQRNQRRRGQLGQRHHFGIRQRAGASVVPGQHHRIGRRMGGRRAVRRPGDVRGRQAAGERRRPQGDAVGAQGRRRQDHRRAHEPAGLRLPCQDGQPRIHAAARVGVQGSEDFRRAPGRQRPL